LHHRVKNNLQIVSSLLGLQRYKSEDAAAISVLQESQDRVQAMSLIHQRLYKNDALSSVNIREYLVDLCESLMSSYGYDRDRFELDISVCTDVLDIDQALPIGLIVNELVTNAFKYAYPGVGRPALRISLEQDHRDLVLVVRDNGVGIDEEGWRQGKDSFGEQLIGALCKQLRATQQMAALTGAGVGAAGTGAGGMAGTEITITMPKEEAAELLMQINILIVEDEQLIALELAAELERDGYRVAGIADTFEEARAIFSREVVDIVLMDIHIRGRLDGVDTAAELMRLRAVPIVYLSARRMRRRWSG